MHKCLSITPRDVQRSLHVIRTQWFSFGLYYDGPRIILMNAVPESRQILRNLICKPVHFISRQKTLGPCGGNASMHEGDTVFAPTSRPVAMAASGMVANTTISSLKQTMSWPSAGNQSWISKDQRTRYDTSNDNKNHTQRDFENGPDYQDEIRGGTGQNPQIA